MFQRASKMKDLRRYLSSVLQITNLLNLSLIHAVNEHVEEYLNGKFIINKIKKRLHLNTISLFCSYWYAFRLPTMG